MYTSMSPKSSPLYICDPNVGGIEWLPPNQLDCDMQPKNLDIAKPVSLTVYWSDISLQVIDGYECSGTKIYAEGYRNYFQSDWTITEEVLVLRIPYQQCQDMVEKRVSPFGKELLRVNDDIFETGFIENRTYITYFFSRGYNETRLNYRIQKLKISISSIDNTIQTTALPVEPCAGVSGFCPTSTGILVWDASSVKTCRLREGRESSCLFRISENMTVLTCQDLKLSLHNVETVKICGVQFGHSQGVFFFLHDKDTMFPEMATPEQVKNIITHPRRKREVGNLTVHPFEAETKAKFNFLYETIKKGTVEAVWKFEQKVCESNKAQLDLINALIQSGHPSLVTSLLYKNDLSYRADFSGDVPTVYKCLEIYEYMFTERLSCIFEWPVRYVYNHKEFEGYMTPATHTIIPVPTNRTRSLENCPRFFFKTHNFVVLLSNSKATQVNLPTLPQKNAVHEVEEFLPPLSFVPTGKMDSSSADVGAFYQMFKEVQQKAIKSGTTEKHVKFVDNTSFSFIGDMFDGIGHWFKKLWNGIIAFLWSIILPAIIIVLIVLVLIIMVSTGALQYLVRIPFLVYSALKRKCLKAPIKRMKKALGYRKQQKKIAPKTADMFAPSAPMLYLGNGYQVSRNGNQASSQIDLSQTSHSNNQACGVPNWQLYPNISNYQQSN